MIVEPSIHVLTIMSLKIIRIYSSYISPYFFESIRIITQANKYGAYNIQNIFSIEFSKWFLVVIFQIDLWTE